MKKRSKPVQGLVFVVLFFLSMRLFGGMQAEQPRQNEQPAQAEQIVQNSEMQQTEQADIQKNEQAEIDNTVSYNETEDEKENLEIHFLDVGQGDATLIVNGEYAMLIDAGDDAHGTAIQNYLQKKNIQKLEYLLLTHPHGDHMGGADVIVTKFEIDKCIMKSEETDTATYRNVVNAMQYKNLQNIEPVIGTKYSLGDAEFTIIAPMKDNYGENLNNESIGILLQHGEKRFLFTGDAEADAENDLIKSEQELFCDVYQVGHHGSSTSSTEAFMEKIKPTYAVISCATGNDYGQPHAEVLNRLRAKGVKVFRTDEQGTIVAISDGKQIEWNCAPSETWAVGE